MKVQIKKRTDTQLTELIGTALLQNALMIDNIEVAKPVRDRGIDMLAYIDINSARVFRAIPIQIKAATVEGFGVDKKYEKFSKLQIVHIWHVRSNSPARFFLTDYKQTKKLANGRKTLANGRKNWHTSAPSEDLKKKLKKFEVSPGQWKRKLKLGS